ncbi:MAG: transglutaminase-like domain-containing protein [Bacteroidales bacterium]|nr:transglutaminase-like domain-containing protein [Bacteroidales bacterium]
MKTTNKKSKLILLAALFFWSCPGIGQNKLTDQDAFYYGIEIGGVLCGYTETSKQLVNENGKEWLQLEDEIIMKLTVLDQDMTVEISNSYKLDQETGQYFYCNRNYSNGSIEMESTTKVDGEIAYFTSNQIPDSKEFDLSEGIILESSFVINRFLEDFIIGNETEKTYKVLDDMMGEVVDKSCTFSGIEELELVGTDYQTTIIDEIDLSSGTHMKYWIDNQTGIPVKLMYSGRTIYLADASVKKQISVADYNDVLFAKVDKLITNILGINYMKVEASINSNGNWITEESLNFPGQKFSGTVENNIIKGVFEVEPIRYDGTNGPAFPFDYPLPDSMLKYLEPESLIESDHPDIILQANLITEGASNSWEAVKAISQWVSEEISGAIPGGTTAINTLKTREGECGSHSRLLTAFCRAVGIPARLSTGCMYTTYFGGSFGQHVWTQVFMGDVGWVAIDATLNEIDYVDAGHIRLGEFTSFQPEEMKILDYKLVDGSEMDGIVDVPEKYKDYLGEYLFSEKNATFKVIYQDGNLAVNIVHKNLVLALKNADEQDRYFSQMTDQINFKFYTDETGIIDRMRLQETIPIPKKSDEDPMNNDLPPNTYTGTYYLAQADVEMLVYVKDKGLVLKDPFTKTESKIWQDVETGIWAVGENELMFDYDTDGNVRGIKYLRTTFMKKQSHEL